MNVLFYYPVFRIMFLVKSQSEDCLGYQLTIDKEIFEYIDHWDNKS